MTTSADDLGSGDWRGEAQRRIRAIGEELAAFERSLPEPTTAGRLFLGVTGGLARAKHMRAVRLAAARAKAEREIRAIRNAMSLRTEAEAIAQHEAERRTAAAARTTGSTENAKPASQAADSDAVPSPGSLRRLKASARLNRRRSVLGRHLEHGPAERLSASARRVYDVLLAQVSVDGATSFTINVHDLRWLAGVTGYASYKRFSNIKSQLLKPAIAALEACPEDRPRPAIAVEMTTEMEGKAVRLVRFVFTWRD